MNNEASPAGPEAMREVVREYIRAVHTTYLDHVHHLPPAERGALPLLTAGGLTVIAAAAKQLHLVATTDSLPAPREPEVELDDEYLGTRWTVRFYDPSILPELGILADEAPGDVRRVLGINNTIYHLSVALGGGMDGHTAQHSGVALANRHTKTARDLDRVSDALPKQSRIVDEFANCVRLGLDRASALLAADLSSGRVAVEPGTSADLCLKALVDDVAR